jgi:hypothetical protein
MAPLPAVLPAATEPGLDPMPDYRPSARLYSLF